MRHVNFDLVLSFDTPEERWRSEQLLLWKMKILTLRNFWFLLDNPDFPHLYDSDMVYMLPEQLERRPKSSQIRALNKFLTDRMGMSAGEAQHHLDLAKGVEIFRDIPRMAEHGGGDCDNMAAMRAAEICVAAYRIGGNSKASPYLVWREDGDRMIYHAKVLHGDGSDEDPSIIMGMGGADRRADRLEECRKNYERYDNMWQIGKRMLADEGGGIERATEIKAAIDSFGYLPKDGVFRVGRPKALSGSTKARGLDLLGAVKSPPLLGRGGGHGGGHHGGHHGGGLRQDWGFGGPAYIVDVDPDYSLDYDLEYEFMSAAPPPQASRRAA